MDALDVALALEGRTREDLIAPRGGGDLGKWLAAEGIPESEEVARVRSLPRRAEPTQDQIERVSAFLRLDPADPLCKGCRGTGCKPCGFTGRAMLRPSQVASFVELFERRGLFGHERVGSGKTLVTLGAPTLLEAQRPILMVPASLRVKTRRDFALYRINWRVRLPRMVSYQEMGRPDREELLDKLAPDLLMLDEAQGVRNLDAAVSRRVRRCIEKWRPIVAVLSGTLMTDELMDYWHLAAWSLGAGAPVPMQQAAAERWAKAVDQQSMTVGLGALTTLSGGFHAHFRGTRGVVTTPGTDCDAAIEISTWRPEMSAELEQTIATTERTKERPDGEPLDEWELPDCLSQLANGFYYVWDPLPPSWWLTPRRAWRAYARAVLDEHLDGFDSESQIVHALDNSASHRQPPAAVEGRQILDAWRAVRDAFKPNTVPVWIDRNVMVQARDTSGPGTLIWTRYRASGFELARIGVPYFPGGTDPESATPGETIALSIDAHGAGRNLQAWHSNLFLSIPANSDAHEQGIGRTHRAGQRSDLVRVRYIGSITYHGEVLSRVYDQARKTAQRTGCAQKIVDATWL